MIILKLNFTIFLKIYILKNNCYKSIPLQIKGPTVEKLT